jgi:hypothetical protein
MRPSAISHARAAIGTSEVPDGCAITGSPLARRTPPSAITTSSSRYRTLSSLALQNKKIVCDLLFARAQRRCSVAADPTHRRRDRVSHRAPHLGPESAAPPACALRDSSAASRLIGRGGCTALSILSAREGPQSRLRGKFVAGLRRVSTRRTGATGTFSRPDRG